MTEKASAAVSMLNPAFRRPPRPRQQVRSVGSSASGRPPAGVVVAALGKQHGVECSVVVDDVVGAAAHDLTNLELGDRQRAKVHHA